MNALTLQPVTDGGGGFAGHLYAEGMWQEAALEYARLLWESGGDTLGMPHVSLRLARCWQEMGRTEDALGVYSLLGSRAASADVRASAMMGAGSVLEERGMTGEARELYLDAGRIADDPAVGDRAMLLAALMRAAEGEWEGASRELASVAVREGPVSPLAAELSEVAAGGEMLPHRSPLLCGVSSALLPGSGQVICGRLRDGLVALGLNGLMAWLVYESVEREDLPSAVLFGWLGLSFYGGNVIGGVRAAESFNASRRRELLQEISVGLTGMP